MNTSLRRSTLALFASSLSLTIDCGAILSSMMIHLSRQYHPSVDLTSYMMTVALTIGVVFNLGFDILTDKFDKKRYMLLAICGFASDSIAIPLMHNVVVVVLLFILINCAYSVLVTVLEAWFTDNLSAINKTKVFSLNYAVLDIGWIVGSPPGTLSVMQNINLPFRLAAACSALPLVFVQAWVKCSTVPPEGLSAAVWSLSVFLRDRALSWSTLSALLVSFVGGAFASCISQYVMVVAGGDFAEKAAAVVLLINAAIVASLQYALGRRLTATDIRPLMTVGIVLFVVGLVGFVFSGDSPLLWGISAALFTIGEVTYAPGEYMFIDNIASAGMKTSYFSVQSLDWLGVAVNPLISDVILATLSPWSLFVALIVVIVPAWAFMIKGMCVRPWGQTVVC